MKLLIRIVLPLCLLSCASFVRAQPFHDLQEGLIDYPVPFPTAIRALLDESPSLLDPSTVRNSTFGIGSTWSSGGTRTSAGFELAPLLISDAVGLSEYLYSRLTRVLLRTRISVAASLPDDGHISPAFGLRFMLHDDADLRAYSLYQDILNEWDKQAPMRDIAPPAANKEDSARHAAALTLIMEESRRKFIRDKIDSLRQTIQETYWNLSVVEMAFNAVYHSVGDNDLAVQRYVGYVSGGWPMLGSNSQIVFGLGGWVGRFVEFSDYERLASFQVRQYLGTTVERLYLEEKVDWANTDMPGYRVGLGSTQRLADGLWIRDNVSLALKGPARPNASLSLTFGTPELH